MEEYGFCLINFTATISWRNRFLFFKSEKYEVLLKLLQSDKII